MTPSDAVFTTERFFARPWRPDEDAPAAFEMYSDPEMVRYVGMQPMPDLESQRRQLGQILERNQRWGRFGSFALIDRANGELVGTAILKPPPASGTGGQPSDDIEIGWHVKRKLWGRGIATEMGRALIDHGFGVLELPVLHAVVESPNARSRAVALRIGMRHTGKTDRYYDLELEHFVIERDDWLSRARRLSGQG